MLACDSQMMRRMIDASVEIEFIRAPGKVCIHADRGQVEQIFMNLCVNACQALSGAGEMAVETSNRKIPVAGDPAWPELEGGSYVQLTVADDGPGVPDAVRNHLFDAFVTTKSAGRGTGLGLAVCRDIADNYEMDINTLYACCAGTTKHVGTSFSDPTHVAGGLDFLHLVAGGEDGRRLLGQLPEVIVLYNAFTGLPARHASATGFNVVIGNTVQLGFGPFLPGASEHLFQQNNRVSIFPRAARNP